MDVLQSASRRTAEFVGRDSWLIRRMRPTYESLLDWFSRGRGVPWEINGVTYLVDPRQRHRLGQQYDAPVARFLSERVRPGQTCFDVGANVGVYVLQFAHWSGPDGNVVAFEPNPAAREILEKHAIWNGIAARVRIVESAVGAENAQAILYAADADGMSRLGSPNQAIADRVSSINVSVITLDHYCDQAGIDPDWLFIDIEGFEIAALMGARDVIKRGRRSLGIIAEMHPNVWGSAHTSKADAVACLDELGLDAIPLTGQTDPLAEYGIVHLSYR